MKRKQTIFWSLFSLGSLAFCDTDLLTTTVWSNALFGTCPPWLYDAAAAMHYDLYLVLDIDVPWVDDTQRFFKEQRQEFMDLCLQALKQHNRPISLFKECGKNALLKPSRQ